MKNIWRVYISDLKRLTTNVVALSVVMGLCIIPSLYAWFNIMSNWDPYGESATSLMKISVYSEDEGIDLNGIRLVIGDMVTESLETNNTINWTFADNKKDALELIQSGECYAGIIIPKDFTKDMLSIMNGNIVNPSIEYYENSKKNAIATKITGKVKTTVQNEINTKLISTLTEIFANAGDYLSGSDIEGSDIISGLKSKLNHISSTLDNYIYMMNTFALLTESASDSIDTTKLLFPNIDSMASSGADSLGNLSDSVDISKDIVGSALSLMNTSLDTISSRLDELSSTVNNITVGSQGNSLSFIKEVDSKDPFSTEILDSIQNLIDSQSPEIADAGKTDIDIPCETTVRKVMVQIGLIHKPRRKPNGITKADRFARKSDDLLRRDFYADRPLKKAVTDISEVKAKDGKLYVSVIFDCFDLMPLGIAIEYNMRASLCCHTLENANKSYPDIKGCIIHSDRGSQYTSEEYRAAVKKYGIIQSMNSAGGRCHDNARCESMWARMKEELFYNREDK